MSIDYLHNHEEFADALDLVSRETGIDLYMVEKDYWVMHCLHELSLYRLDIEFKGGTSLSKAFGIIHRFSEDLDLAIIPKEDIVGFDVKFGDNHNKKVTHIESRKNFFDWIAKDLVGKIRGVESIERDTTYDDLDKYRNGGVVIKYPSDRDPLPDIKEGILLELGFGGTAPNTPRDISSWVYDKWIESNGPDVIDNRAKGILCYLPQYTLVEKMDAVMRKYNQYKEAPSKGLQPNFLRHYYDICQLLGDETVSAFIGSPEYNRHKKSVFRSRAENVAGNEAFKLSDQVDFNVFELAYQKYHSLYYKGQQPFIEIIDVLRANANRF